MPIEMWEAPESGRTQNTSSGRRVEKIFTLKGTTDRLLAEGYVLLNTDDELENLPRQNIDLTPYKGSDLWKVILNYGAGSSSGGPIEPSDIGDERASFSTRGNRVLVTQAKRHIEDYGIGETEPPNHNGAINVTEDGPQGVEIDQAAFTFEVRKVVAASDMDAAYSRALLDLTNKTNNAVWRGYQPGELRFLGCDGTQRDSESWDLTFSFLGSPNLQNQTVDEVQGIDQKGHEYAWGTYETVVDDSVTPPVKVKKLIAIHIEELYGSGDFNRLNLNA